MLIDLDSNRDKRTILKRTTLRALAAAPGSDQSEAGQKPDPVFAVAGQLEGDDVRILGTGVLIAPQYILTAGHLVSPQVTKDRKIEIPLWKSGKFNDYRVYSPSVGIKTISGIHANRHGDLAILELESTAPNGFEPFEISQETPLVGTQAYAFGFGGDVTGLLERIRVKIDKSSTNPGEISLELDAELGPRDSGAPIFVSGTNGRPELAGIYAGVRMSSSSGAQSFRKFAVDVVPHFEWISPFLDKFKTVDGGSLESLEITPPPELEVDPPQYWVGAGGKESHHFEVYTQPQELLVTVNATVMPLRYRPRMKVSVYRNERLIKWRAYPSPLQSFRLPSGETKDLVGKWRIEVESESEIAYQVAATLRHDGPVSN